MQHMKNLLYKYILRRLSKQI